MLTVPFVLLFRMYNRHLKRINSELIDNRDQLEVRVKERTADLQAEKERAESLVCELEQALGKIKTLSGLLPICAHCKKIRDDKGYWNQIEGYIQEHTDAEFSHSLCPECAEKLYPEEDDG